MGRRGPKPTPTARLKARGSWRANTRKGEPQPPAEIPDPPASLSDAARKHWQQIAEQLNGLGVMSAIHSQGLALLADALVDYNELSDECLLADRLVRGSKGQDVLNPLYSARSDAWTRVLKALREFGMTPSAIAGVNAHGQGEEKETKGLGRFRLRK